MRQGLYITLYLAAALPACTENRTPATGQDAGATVLSCLPNLDGRIDADELPVALEARASYFVSENTPVQLAGMADGNALRWSFPDETSADQRLSFAAAPLLDQWYAESFPDATFILANDVMGTVDGIYRKDDAGLWLLGLASAMENPPEGKTLYRYASPVALLRFPIEDGDRYTEVGEIDSGVVRGLPYVGTDTYEIVIDGSGELELPYVSFSPVLRTYTYVLSEPAAGGVTTSRRQVSFLFECFGEVMRATSRADEPTVNFTTAAELRRFAL